MFEKLAFAEFNGLLIEGPYYSYELSICLSEGILEGVQVFRSGGLGVLKNAVPVRNVQIQLFAEEIWGKNSIFQDNIGLWVLKTFVLKK